MEQPICGITLEPISDEELHTSPGGSTYKKLSILRWMDDQSRTNGIVSYPTRETIHVSTAIDLGILTDYADTDSDSYSDSESEMDSLESYCPEEYLKDLLVTWLDCFPKLREEAEDHEEISDDASSVEYSVVSRTRLTSLMIGEGVSEESMPNFHKIGRMLAKDEILNSIHYDGTSQKIIESINPFCEKPHLLTREYIWSLELMNNNGFPIKTFEKKGNEWKTEIHYGGILDIDEASIKSSEMDSVTRKATIEIVENFIDLIGPETICTYLDEKDEPNLSANIKAIISRYHRDTRNRRRTFKRDISTR